jgi:hypothetical protein
MPLAAPPSNGASPELRHEGAWCSDQGVIRNDPNPHSGSDEADIVRASQRPHAIRDMERHADFCHATFVYT